MPVTLTLAADVLRVSTLLPLLAACSRAGAGMTPVVGLPCEDCEMPLIDLPAAPPVAAYLAPDDEPGERLQLTGRVTDAQGRPRRGVIGYAHQTNPQGVYPGEKSDDGPFLTIHPGSYPGTRMPQHIHLYVIEAGRALYYIDDVLFRDDPNLTPAVARKADQGRGGSGIVAPVRVADGWQARRDIVPGRNIAGYPGCAP